MRDIQALPSQVLNASPSRLGGGTRSSPDHHLPTAATV